MRSYLGQLAKAIDVVIEDDENISPENYSKLWEYKLADNATRLLTGFDSGDQNYSISNSLVSESARTIGDVYQAVRFPDQTLRSFSNKFEFPSLEMVQENDNERNQYRLSLTDEHIDALSQACWMYSQIRLGNFGVITDFVTAKEGYELRYTDKINGRKLLDILGENILGDKMYLLNRNTPEDVQLAYEMSLETQSILAPSQHMEVSVFEENGDNYTPPTL